MLSYEKKEWAGYAYSGQLFKSTILHKPIKCGLFNKPQFKQLGFSLHYEKLVFLYNEFYDRNASFDFVDLLHYFSSIRAEITEKANDSSAAVASLPPPTRPQN